MPADGLIESLPDLVVLTRRDGGIIAHAGGQSVPDLKPAGERGSYQAAWSVETAALIKKLTRKAIAARGAAEARFEEHGRSYEVRVTAQGPDRAMCQIRALPADAREESADTSGDRPRPELDRRGFLRRFKESLAVATLQEKSIAVAVLYVEGISDIAQIITSKVAEQIMSTAILRLSAHSGGAGGEQPGWYLGQLGESILAIVVEASDRGAIEVCIGGICDSLRQPLAVGDAEFRLTPYAGVGVLGLDATSPRALLDNARAAAAEARRTGTSRVQFFTDTLQLRSLARLDIARELREAIASGHIRLRYVGRHDLVSGRVVAWVSYVRWLHPLRGEIRPAEFLRVAETTGLGMSLSRSLLSSLREDFAAHSANWDADVRLSFGALRSHVLHEDFVADVERFLDASGIPADRLELRIAEKAFVARDPADFRPLERRGVRLVVDEVARGMGSLPLFARAPLWGMQLDRVWVTELRNDDVARKVCRAGISIATALGLTPIATGVDDEAQREALLELGCRYGTGDLYRAEESHISRRSGSAERV
jgi:predicted signal transduction protein with EAL and GGDEF domain